MRFIVSIASILVLFIYIWAASPPMDFPRETIVSVPEGVGLYVLAERLEEDGVIRSPFWFRFAAIVLGGERGMKAGEYYFAYPQSTFAVAWRVVRGDYQVETLKLTIPEGFTVRKISRLFDERFPLFDHEMFERTAPEGFLFPDTYFIGLNATATSTIRLLRDNFNRKVLPIIEEVETSGRTLADIITMASILEGEARTLEDRKIVADILWKRLEAGIALQVDTSFSYINGKTTKELTLEDLEINSPYNTYLYRGLPPTPISNPGLESIQAALRPTTTPYLYFLTADDGTMHYSRTFDEHIAKKQRYIKR